MGSVLLVDLLTPPPQKCWKVLQSGEFPTLFEGGGPYISCRTTRSCVHKALSSRIEGGFQSKKILVWPAGPNVAASRKRGRGELGFCQRS